MTFNSWIFVSFFVVVYALFLTLRTRIIWRNTLLVIASYVFYGIWDWRFLSLLAISTVVDYSVAILMERCPPDAPGMRIRRTLLSVSVTANMLLLGFFKYFNFFADSLQAISLSLGLHVSPVTLNVLLPVGISFYTFQTMSYVIDVYRGRLRACRSLLDFSLFVSFFPQLVAGPIERATNLLPQIQRVNPITIAQVDAGIFLILTGFFKKLVVADNMAPIANSLFNHPEAYGGLDLWLGLLAFAFQIYGDFSGYSDIARGVSKLMGFELMVNFNLPYMAVNPQDFWRRWHISLSIWLRDYLYIPLGGNRQGPRATERNLMLTMLLGGLWHGAAWNFLIWGGYQGALLIVHRRVSAWQARRGMPERVSHVLLPLRWALCFVFVLYGWLIFRATSLDQVLALTAKLWTPGCRLEQGLMIQMFWCLVPLIALELIQHRSQDLWIVPRRLVPVRALVYSLIVVWIMVFGARETTEFIYFQF